MANAMNQGAGDATLHPLVQGAGSHPPLLTVGIPCLPLIIEDRKFNAGIPEPPKTKNLLVFQKLTVLLIHSVQMWVLVVASVVVFSLSMMVNSFIHIYQF